MIDKPLFWSTPCLPGATKQEKDKAINRSLISWEIAELLQKPFSTGKTRSAHWNYAHSRVELIF